MQASFLSSSTPHGAGAWLRRAAAAALLLALAACGGGGTVPEPGVSTRVLPAEFFSRAAVNYSPYRAAVRNPAAITDAMVREDLQLLVASNIRLIRTFDSTPEVARRVLTVIRDNGFDIKVQLGVWIASGQEAANQAEIERAVALAREFPSTVLALSVGNETMVSWSFNAVKPADMARYIVAVRDRVSQPVTTNDNWAFWASAPSTILDVVDFVAVHTYALADSVYLPGSWDWKQTQVSPASRAQAMMDAALAKTKADYQAVRSYLDGLGRTSKPIVIGETGWKAEASGGELQRAHPVNQKMFFDGLNAWVAQARTGGSGPKAVFWFEAFDEPWKGSDDKWGLFNVNRQARYALQSRLPQSQWEPGTYTAADAVHFIETATSGPVTASRYTLYADATTAGEARPGAAVATYGWDSPATAYAGEGTTQEATGDSAATNHFYEIGPAPAVWGWGLILNLTNASADLSNFAGGRLNFSIKTTYPGKLEFGFFTGAATDGSGYDVYLAVDPASNAYGYRNDGTWRQVSIPVADIVARGAKASCCQNSSTSRLDLARVTSPFVIADRYGVTGKANGTNDRTKIYIDAVYWSR